MGPALQIAGIFQLVLFVVTWVQQNYGNAGLLVSSAIIGITDVDALTISMAKNASGTVAPTVAAEAIALGILFLPNCRRDSPRVRFT